MICNVIILHLMKIGLDKNGNIVRKLEKHWFPAFFPFSTIFSKVCCLGVVKSRFCVEHVDSELKTVLWG